MIMGRLNNVILKQPFPTFFNHGSVVDKQWWPWTPWIYFSFKIGFNIQMISQTPGWEMFL